MRRKDREMDREFGLTIIDKAQFGTLCLVDEQGISYGVPLSIARNGENLYFHSAKAGKKVDLLKPAESVSIVFVGEHKIPQVITEQEVKKVASSSTTLGRLTRKLFTTEFESAIVLGQVEKLELDTDKIHGLRIISEKFTPQ